MSDSDLRAAAMQALIECQHQAPHDLCGEQREWYLPRLRQMLMFMIKAFPQDFVEALQVAKTPYGDLVCPPDK
jgi:hypothetical protein